MALTPIDLSGLRRERCVSTPFNHWVIENFLTDPLSIEREFLPFNSPSWLHYDTPVQQKMACNNWNLFPPATYSLFNYLMSGGFIEGLSLKVGCELFPDPGLHGGGWHCHGDGGVLAPHLDYSIHPKLGLQRKVNLLIYVEPNIRQTKGGELGLWTGDEEHPHSLAKVIPPTFNRAVLFDTTQNSWHGMVTPFISENGICRRSLAVYYLCRPEDGAPLRPKAEFCDISLTEPVGYGDNI